MASTSSDNQSRAFRPYGTRPPFDLDDYKDSFDLWEHQWINFLELSTIDTALDEGLRPKYKASMLKSCLSKHTLFAVLSSGLTSAQLQDPKKIIETLRNRCNAGRNRHLWRAKFVQRTQRPNETLDDWLCDLRDLARKSEFTADCSATCGSTRILGQLIHGINNQALAAQILEKGQSVTLETAISLLRTAEADSKLSANQATGQSLYKKCREGLQKREGGTEKMFFKKYHCMFCGGKTRHPREECPANGKICTKCELVGHFQKVCLSKTID